MNVDHGRRRRKWDVAGPVSAPGGSLVQGADSASRLTQFYGGKLSFLVAPRPPVFTLTPGQPLSQDIIDRAKQGAAAVVEKLNLDLMRQGVLRNDKNLAVRAEDDRKEPAEEVVINDAPPHIRFNLTKRATQDDVQRATDTVIVTRGRYFPPGMPRDGSEKPLHLRVTPGATCVTDEQKHLAVQAAVAELNRILGEDHWSQNPQTVSHSPQAQPGVAPQIAPPWQQQSACYMDVVYVGFTAPYEFSLGNRLQGPGGSYLQHIASETGTTVVLAGQGSGVRESVEPLHFHIISNNFASLEDAKRLAQNLIDTVRGELRQFHAEFQHTYSSTTYPSATHCLPGTSFQHVGYAAPVHSQHPPVPQPSPPYVARPQAPFLSAQGYHPAGYAAPPPASSYASVPSGQPPFRPQQQYLSYPQPAVTEHSGPSTSSSGASGHTQLSGQEPAMKRRRFTEFKNGAQVPHSNGGEEPSVNYYGVKPSVSYPQTYGYGNQPAQLPTYASGLQQEGSVKVYAAGSLVDYGGDD